MQEKGRRIPGGPFSDDGLAEVIRQQIQKYTEQFKSDLNSSDNGFLLRTTPSEAASFVSGAELPAEIKKYLRRIESGRGLEFEICDNRIPDQPKPIMIFYRDKMIPAWCIELKN